MPNATVQASARALPEGTNRRAVLGAVIAAGAVAATALPTAAAESPALSTADRRVLDLWRRRARLRAALHRVSEQSAAAEAQLPMWARSGPEHVLAKGELFIPGIDDAVRQVGRSEVADLDERPIGALGRILVRRSPDNLINEFYANTRAGMSLDEARRKLTRALVALDKAPR